MRGYLILGFSLLGLVSFYALMFFSESWVLFWLFLELGTLCVIPSFFFEGKSEVLSSLFNYIVVSSVSSSIILCGFLEEGLVLFVLLGFLIKFGLFPFWGWVYNVILNSNWFVVWCISTLLKLPLFLFPFLLSGGGYFVVSCFVCVTFLGLSVIFWVFSYSWFHCWCHMMISSSAGLVAMSFCVPANVLFYLFIVYCFWSSAVLVFFNSCGSSDNTIMGGLGYYFFFSALLVSTPVSLSIFYKFLMSIGIFSCSFLVICCWIVYSVSEQFYLMKFIMSCDLPKAGVSFWSFV